MESYKIELEHIRLELIHRRKNNVNSINHLMISLQDIKV